MSDQKPYCYIDGVPQYGSPVENFMKKKPKSFLQWCRENGIEHESDYRRRMQKERKNQSKLVGK